MSYILDALRRAESERERGTVPTLHSSAMPAGISDDGGARWRWQPWAWGVGGLVLLLLVSGLLMSRDGSEVVVAVPNTLPIPALAPQVIAAPTPPQIAPPATVQIDPSTISLPSPPLPAGRATAAVVAPRTSSAPVAANPRPAVETPVPTVSQLPEDIRRELPALTVGGAMYSDTPANRMLILNGQVFHEGDKVAANLVLEQIKLKGAVLSFKGQRYAVSY